VAKETSALDSIPGTGKIMLLLQSVQRHPGAWPISCPVGGVKCWKHAAEQSPLSVTKFNAAVVTPFLNASSCCDV